jgi:hypothetical protein
MINRARICSTDGLELKVQSPVTDPREFPERVEFAYLETIGIATGKEVSNN